jgi:hypothetical protein
MRIKESHGFDVTIANGFDPTEHLKRKMLKDPSLLTDIVNNLVDQIVEKHGMQNRDMVSKAVFDSYIDNTPIGFC